MRRSPESQHRPKPENARLHTNTLPDLGVLSKSHAKPTFDTPIKAGAASTSIVAPRLVTGLPSRLRSINTYPFNNETPTGSELYSATPLGAGDIRVLELPPSGNPNHPIYCYFEVRSLLDVDRESSARDYKALSGRWDTQYEASKISVYTNSRKICRLPAPLSLNQALHQIRHPTEPVFLWVDVVCVNPDDENEQEAQAPMIPDIFRGASEVIIWLGTSAEASNTAIEFIPRVLDLREIDTLVNHDDTPRQWQALVNLLRRPYFSRQWTFLEIILARRATLYCGDQHIEWAEFCDAVVMLGSRFDEVQLLLKRAAASSKYGPLSLLKLATRGTRYGLYCLVSLPPCHVR